MTKAEEKKVLEQIRKLIESTGENSYISMAFEGVLEDAEENIENDFGCSWKQRAEAAEKKIAEYKKVRDDLVEERDELQAGVTVLNNRIENLVEALKTAEAELNKAHADALKERKEITIETEQGGRVVKQFESMRYIRSGVLEFITVTQKSGWADSYKMADLKELTIQ